MRLNQNPQHCTLTDITEFLVDVEEGLLRGLGALGQAVHLILEALQQRRHRQPISDRLFSHVAGLWPIIKGENGTSFDQFRGQVQKSSCGWDLDCGWYLAKWLERLAVNAEVATFLCSIPASSDTMNLRGGRWTSVEKCTWKEKRKIYRSPVIFFLFYGSIQGGHTNKF